MSEFIRASSITISNEEFDTFSKIAFEGLKEISELDPEYTVIVGSKEINIKCLFQEITNRSILAVEIYY